MYKALKILKILLLEINRNRTIAIAGENPEPYNISRDYKIEVEITIPAQGYQWLTVE